MTLLYLLRVILGKLIRHSYVYRPTEILCFQNIEKENKIIQKYGKTPNFTDFEKKIYYLDLYLKHIIIPEAIKKNKIKDRSEKIPIPLYWLCEKTSHTPDYINKILSNIDDKIFIREKFGIDPVLPDIKGFKLEKMLK